MARKSRKDPAVPAPTEDKPLCIWRAALYIRLSVEFNSKRGDSLETQRQIMESYLAFCPDIAIYNTYTDNGATGQNFERKAFQQMLTDIEAGKINCVVVKNLSRLGRNAIDAGYYIEKYFPLHHVRFIAVNDRYDSEAEHTEVDHIILPVKNLINEAVALDLSRKVRSQAHQAMKDGAYIGARPPYGYLKAPDNCHKLIVNEDTAPVVRQIFAWAENGVPLNVIVKRLNESGTLTPGYYLAKIGLISNKMLMGSGKWQTWTVNKILSDEVYVGDMVQGKSMSVRRKQVLTKPEDWIVVRDTHEPIISRELFERAQAARKQTAEKASKTKSPYTENILRGRIFCGCCGKNLHRQKCHGRYIFHCISNDRIGKGACDNTMGGLHEDELLDSILTIIRRETEAFLGNRIRQADMDNRLAEQKNAMSYELAKLHRETANNRKYLTSLYESMATGVITKAEYAEMKAGYERKIEAAIQRAGQLQEQRADLEKQAAGYFDLTKVLAEAQSSQTLFSLLVNQVIERITVYDRERIEIRFSYEHSFDLLWEVLADE